MGDLDHRRPGRLDMAPGAAWGSHEAADSSGHVSLAPAVVREPRRWQAALVEGITVVHHVGEAEPPCCEDGGRQCGPGRRLALERRLG